MSIKLKDIYKLFLAISAISLAFAYIAEYTMGHAPCVLCAYQRFPYLIFILVSIIGLAGPAWRAGLFYLMAAVICTIVLAGYHSGLELGFFELSSFCKPLVAITDNLSISDFKNMLYSSEMPLCNKPTFFVLKLSMTQWNLLLNLGLFIVLILAIKWGDKNAKTIF
jgi:disulfide bond formation protein DsbB